MRIYWFAFVVVCMTMTSCFKDESLNAECDILKAWVHYDNPEEYVWYQSDTIVDNVYSTDTIIQFCVKSGTDMTHLAPKFITTDGAVLEPGSGVERDFSEGRLPYYIISQDGNWQRTYWVEFTEVQCTRGEYDFEYERLNSKGQYYEWYELWDDGTEVNSWASGNGGFAISKMLAKPDEYPTVSVNEGLEGKCVKLTTRSTGAIAEKVKMPLAAGNLFLGKFNVEYALQDALGSTQFGLPFNKKPIRLTGYYKYTPGEKFQDRNKNVIAGRIDEGAIYAILYKNHDAEGKPVMLDGSNVQTSEHIVARAIMQKVNAVADWTKFEVEFVYDGIEFDQETLDTYGYNLTVVFSSSKDGASFQGAIGSTMYIDEVKVICEPTE